VIRGYISIFIPLGFLGTVSVHASKNIYLRFVICTCRWFHGVQQRTPGPLLGLEQVEADPEDALAAVSSLVVLLSRGQGLQGHKDLAVSLPRVRAGRP
jgi:hypothetical protein